MITVVQGRPGQGKSVFLVAEIFRFLRKGHMVYSNIEVKVPEKWKDQFVLIHSLDECTKLRSGKIVLDEIQVYLNSRNWDKLDTKFQLLLQQHRKRGLDILGAAQSIKRADVVFRELVQVFYAINKIITFRIGRYSFGFFYLREYDPDSIESQSRSYEPIGWFFPFFADPYTMSLYDTTQEVTPRDPIGKRVVETYIMRETKSVSPVLIGKEMYDA